MAGSWAFRRACSPLLPFGNVGDDPDPSQLVLYGHRQRTGVHDQTVHLDEPGHEMLLDHVPADELLMEPADTEQVPDQRALVAHRRLLHAEQLGKPLHLQMRGLSRVRQEVHPADRVHDPGGPDAAVPTEQRRRALAGELHRQSPAQPRVLGVQMLGTERIGDLDNVRERRQRGRRHTLRLQPGSDLFLHPNTHHDGRSRGMTVSSTLSSGPSRRGTITEYQRRVTNRQQRSNGSPIPAALDDQRSGKRRLPGPVIAENLIDPGQEAC